MAGARPFGAIVLSETPGACEGAAETEVGERELKALPVPLAYGGVRPRRMSQTRSLELGPAARPVAVPEDLDVPSVTKAIGRVELPLHARWSGPPITYDLADRTDRARVYEQVPREGIEDDVKFYIDADQLVELWDELVLPPSVRKAWEDWFRRHRHGE